MNKKTQASAPARKSRQAKASLPSLEQASGRVRAAKDEFKRLRSLAKVAKRDLKAARKTLKKVRKLAAPDAAKQPAVKARTAHKTAKPSRRGAKKNAQTPARALAPAAIRAAREPRGGQRALTTRRVQPAQLEDAALLANTETELGEESGIPAT
jgi:exonuclease VII small subunit